MKAKRFSSGGSLREEYDGTYFLATDVLPLVEAAQSARHVIDEMMGDTDIDGDESDEFKAMQLLATALRPFDE
jgi:hypothetical protein